MVRLSYFGELREYAGKTEEQIEAHTLQDVFQFIRSEYGAAAQKAAKRALIVVNGVRADTLRQQLPDSCTVAFFPLCSGG